MPKSKIPVVAELSGSNVVYKGYTETTALTNQANATLEIGSNEVLNGSANRLNVANSKDVLVRIYNNSNTAITVEIYKFSGSGTSIGNLGEQILIVNESLAAVAAKTFSKKDYPDLNCPATHLLIRLKTTTAPTISQIRYFVVGGM